MDATVVGVREYTPARLECAVPLGAGGYDGPTRYCVAIACKLTSNWAIRRDRAHVTRKKVLGLADDQTRADHDVPVEGQT